MDIELLKYYPNRFYFSRPFVKDLIQKYPLMKDNSDLKRNRVNDIRVRKEELKIWLNNFYLNNQDKLEILNSKDMDKIIIDEVFFLDLFSAFINSGRNIFHLQPVLSDLFLHTDVDDILLKTLKTPYNIFYIHFGVEANLVFNNSVIDGTFVTYANDSNYEEYLLTFTLVTINPNWNYLNKNKLLELFLNDKRHSFELLGFKEDTVGKAIDTWSSVISEHQFDFGESQKWFPTVLEIAKLIVNTLCYFSSTKKDINICFPQNTPASLLKKIENSNNSSVVKRTLNKLESMGYTKIHFCGNTLQNKYGSLYQEGNLAPHWRRGHWRNQAYGSNFSKHKFLWIKPTIVRADKGLPEKGHIYNIDENIS